MRLILKLLLVAWLPLATHSFEWVAGGRPEVTRQAIAGLWRLKPQPTYPLKEYTVRYPRPMPPKVGNDIEEDQELLLMLKEDGSFQQYQGSFMDANEKQQDVNDEWSRFQKEQQQEEALQQESQQGKKEATATTALTTRGLVKGVWDYRDGKLILAADRQAHASDSNSLLPAGTNHQHNKPHLDKLIVGRVVATYETSLQDNPILLQQQGQDAAINHTDHTTPLQRACETEVDAHLTVPKGSLKVGKFFYPKSHPSFFEQPIYNPTTANKRFQLSQVLGALNTAKARQEREQKTWYEPKHFFNKTFLLSSHPLQNPKGQKKRYNDDSDNEWASQKKPNEPETINPHAESSPIRVFQVKLFPNRTFASVWGTGDVILRGIYDTFSDGTVLWMKIFRFGFGRSVSGSVYSEGKALTHEDAKTYWGTIRQVNVTAKLTHDQEPGPNDLASILEVEGSVLFGGVGAEPVGRFLMREMVQEENMEHGQEEVDEEEDEEEEKLLDPSSLDALFEMKADNVPDRDSSDDKDGVDWSFSEQDETDAFQ